MAESSKEGYPAKPVRPKELAEASDHRYANRRQPPYRLRKKGSSLG